MSIDQKTPAELTLGGFEPKIEDKEVKVTVPEDVFPHLLPSAAYTLRGMLGLGRRHQIAFLDKSDQRIKVYSPADPHFYDWW